MNITPLSQIESAAFKYSQARKNLADLMQTMQEQIDAIKRTHLSGIKSAVGKCTKQHTELKELIEAHPESFEKPRSHVFHDIKVGYRKGTGGIVIHDEDQTVNLIRKHFDREVFDTLIKTTETPIKKSLETLDVATLKKIGCSVEDTGDVVFIKPTDSAVEKAVNALLKEATKDLEDKAAA